MQKSRRRRGLEFGVLPLMVALCGCAASNGVSNPKSSAPPSHDSHDAAGAARREPTPVAPPEVALPQATQEPEEIAPQGSTVLHVGDSFAGALGLDLNREFKKLGVRGILKYRTATYIPTWAWGKELKEYISQYHPDLVLVTLGANELDIPDPQVRVHAIEKLVSTIGGRPCVWIAPPLWQGAKPQLLSVIREHAAPCSYMDSTALVPNLPRGKDHIHPTEPARAEWAKRALEWLLHERAPEPGRPWALRETPRSAASTPSSDSSR